MNYRQAVEAVLDDPTNDGVLMILVPTLLTSIRYHCSRGRSDQIISACLPQADQASPSWPA